MCVGAVISLPSVLDSCIGAVVSFSDIWGNSFGVVMAIYTKGAKLTGTAGGADVRSWTTPGDAGAISTRGAAAEGTKGGACVHVPPYSLATFHWTRVMRTEAPELSQDKLQDLPASSLGVRSVDCSPAISIDAHPFFSTPCRLLLVPVQLVLLSELVQPILSLTSSGHAFHFIFHASVSKESISHSFQKNQTFSLP